MVDRQQLEAMLSRRFPGSTPIQIAAAANAIMAMIREDEKLADDRGGTSRTRDLRPAPTLPHRLP